MYEPPVFANSVGSYHPSFGRIAITIVATLCMSLLQSHSVVADSAENEISETIQGQTPSEYYPDYRSDTTGLEFTRHRVASSANSGPLGAGWRHTYQTNLFIKPRYLVVIDPQGRQIHFDATASSSTQADTTDFKRYHNKSAGTIYRHANRSLWQQPDGKKLFFTGSYLSDTVNPRGEHVRLAYDQRRLSTVKNNRGDVLNFGYKNGKLTSVLLPGGKLLKYRYGEDGQLQRVRLPDDKELAVIPTVDDNSHDNMQCEPEDEANKLCDTEANPLDANIALTETVPDATLLDARPASCKSYFEVFAGTRRGMAIEGGFEQHEYFSQYNSTVRSFPIADFYNNNSVRVVRTRDLTLATYNGEGNNEALLKRLLKDGEEIQKKLLDRLNDEPITVTELGQVTTLNKPNVQRVVLDLVIQRGMASPSQIAQIADAQLQLKQRFGVELHVIEIP